MCCRRVEAVGHFQPLGGGLGYPLLIEHFEKEVTQERNLNSRQ